MPKMRCLTIAVIILCTTVTFSQATAENRKTRFSSVYTDMERDCRSALTKQERKEAAAAGQDSPQVCKGYGGYYPNISYSAVVEYVWIGSRRDDDFSLTLNPNGLNLTGRKLEWRLADGKPFAVILRVAYYSGEGYNSGGSPFDVKYKEKEALVIKGLKGYEKIDFEIDAKTPNVNEQARGMADDAFTAMRR